MRFACSETPFFANHNGSSAETGFTNNFYAAFTRRFACRANTGPANHNGTSAQTHFANILHEEDSQRHQRRQRAPQPFLEALGTAPATKTASGTSGDNPRRSPFWRLWVLRLPRRQLAASAATTRAAAPSGGSGYCACHEEDSQRHQRRQRAPQPLLKTLGTAPATKTASGTQRHQRRQRAPQPLLEALGTAPATRKTASGDNARRSPFWRLWVLRLPRRQPAAPAATTRAAAPSGGSGYCACHEEDSQRHQRRQRAPRRDRLHKQLLRSIYKAIRMPCKHWSCKSQWHQCTDTLRKHPSRGRQPAAPAATTRAAAPSGGSGYCACHEDSQRHQRRQPAPQPLLAALGTAPATRKTASGTSGDNARRGPFWRLWVLRLPRRQPAAPSGTSGDNARRSPFWRLWVLRLPRGRQPAATTRAAAPSGGSGYCACHEDSQRHQRRQRAPQPLLEALGCACHEEDSQRHQRRQRAPQPLLEALGTAPATKTASGTSGENPRRSFLGTAPATRKTASGTSGDNARRSPF